MYLWVDDKKDPKYTADMFNLEEYDWTWSKTAQEALEWIKTGTVAVLALDNDLGPESEMDGRDLAHQLLELVMDYPEFQPPSKMYSISFNPVSDRELRLTFTDIERVVEERRGI